MATELVMSNSKAKTFRRCEKQFHFKHVLKLRPKVKSVHLELGSWVHDLLMHHYDGEDWRKRHRELTKEFNKMFEEEREHYGDLPAEAGRLMRAYVRHYKKLDQRDRTVDTEIDETIELPNGMKFRFIIDRIIERDDGLWLQDHKTTKTFKDRDILILDPQLTRYFYAAHILDIKPLAGVEYNEIRKKAPTVPRMTKKSGKLERKANIDTDYWTYLQAIKDNDLPVEDYRQMLRRLKGQNRFFRRTPLPRHRSMIRNSMQDLVDTAREIERAIAKDRFPRTVDTSCLWSCDYKDPCLVEYQGGDIEHILKNRYEVKEDDD